MEKDEKFMREAIRLAKKGLGRTSPNPAVGCVIVRNDEIIGRGFHKKAGAPHAEIEAIEDVKSQKKKLAGTTLYCTLEPCCHHGKTPPCTDAIIANGIVRVVYASCDPNPKASGKGDKKLKKAGIEISSGVLEKEASELNAAYFKYIKKSIPLIIAKAALSADGKLCALDGSSKWITGSEARREAHRMRNIYDAVMVGAHTVALDNPRLTCRIQCGRNPVRIIVDSHITVPLEFKIFTHNARVIVACLDTAPQSKVELIRDTGHEVLFCKKNKDGMVDLKDLIKKLGKSGITSVMIEGGPGLLGSAFDTGIVDRTAFFFAPKIIGAGKTITCKNKKGMSGAINFKDVKTKKLGNDILMLGRIKS